MEQRHFLLFTTLLFIGVFVMACSSSHHDTNAGNDEWPEMDSFHMTMAEAFHPLSDSGNVEPAIRLIDQLGVDADKWASASIPDKVNNDEMKFKLEKLRTDIHMLAEIIHDNASENQISTAMHTLHDQFHEIMEIWHSSDSGESQMESHH